MEENHDSPPSSSSDLCQGTGTLPWLPLIQGYPWPRPHSPHVDWASATTLTFRPFNPPSCDPVRASAVLTWSITTCGRSSVRLRLLHYDHVDPLTATFQWTSAADQALHLLKLRFFSAPVLQILNHSTVVLL